MSQESKSRLEDEFKIETCVYKTDDYELRKAYSTKDGKEVIFNTINVMPWKPEVVHCFRNALHIVRDYKSCVFFLEVLGDDYSEKENKLYFVTENITENVESVYAGIGSVRLTLVRKWLQDLLNGLKDLHSDTSEHPAYIHGRIRLQHLLYFRSTGQVRIGGYYWLAEQHADTSYSQCNWAEEDDMIGYYAPEIFTKHEWTSAVDIYALGMCFIHLLTGYPPYYELDKSIIRETITTGEPPRGLQVIQSIDENLYLLLKACISPIEERPSAEQLLTYPFFTDTTNTEIEIHPNQKIEKSTEIIFSKAFLRDLSTVPPPETESRLSSSFLQSLQKSDSMSIKIPSKESESKSKTVSRKIILSGRSAQPNLSRHNSTNTTNDYTCVCAMNNLVISILLPASLLQPHLTGYLRMKLPVSITSESPWNIIDTGIQEINHLRNVKQFPDLSKDDEWIIEEAICESIQQAFDRIIEQQEGISSVYSYISSISLNKTLSLYLPSWCLSENNSEETLSTVSFPIISKGLSFKEFIQTNVSSLVEAIDELRKNQLGLPVLTDQEKHHLTIETTTVLTIHLLQLIKNTSIFQVNFILVRITHYQIIEKDSSSYPFGYDSNVVLSPNCRLTLHISIPFLTIDTVMRSTSMEFSCYYVLKNEKEVERIVRSILCHIDNLKIACSQYEKSLLEEKLTEEITKVILSVKVEEKNKNSDQDQNTESLFPWLPTTIENITIPEKWNSEEREIHIAGYDNLKTIVVFSNSCMKVSKLEITNCPNLSSIHIENHCFEGETGSLLLSNCPQLQELVIGCSFLKYTKCELSNLPKLVSIQVSCWTVQKNPSNESHKRVITEPWYFVSDHECLTEEEKCIDEFLNLLSSSLIPVLSNQTLFYVCFINNILVDTITNNFIS